MQSLRFSLFPDPPVLTSPSVSNDIRTRYFGNAFEVWHLFGGVFHSVLIAPSLIGQSVPDWHLWFLPPYTISPPTSPISPFAAFYDRMPAKQSMPEMAEPDVLAGFVFFKCSRRSSVLMISSPLAQWGCNFWSAFAHIRKKLGIWASVEGAGGNRGQEGNLWQHAWSSTPLSACLMLMQIQNRWDFGDDHLDLSLITSSLPPTAVTAD